MLFSIQQQAITAIDTLIFSILFDGFFFLVVAAVAFNAGRQYERKLAKQQQSDDHWEPKEPTL